MPPGTNGNKYLNPDHNTLPKNITEKRNKHIPTSEGQKNTGLNITCDPFKMDKDPTVTMHHRSSYISGCMMSPSCFPVNNELQYSRIHYCSSPVKRRGWRWRRILRRLMRESKITLCRSKPISFQYDPVSYSQNFDEGSHLQEPTRLSLVFQDVSAAAFDRLDSQCKI